MTESNGSSPLPRVLVPLTIHFAVRYVVRTGLLERLGAHCRPVLALSWDDPELVTELRATGAEVVRLPDSELSHEVRVLLSELEVAFARRLRSPSTAIDRARRHVDRPLEVRVRRRASAARDQLRARLPGAEARVEQQLRDRLTAGTNVTAHEAFLTEQRIDAVFSVTPFVVQELLLLHAVGRLGLPRATSILSFDNITTRPPLPVRFDRYLVWNRFNEQEILRSYPGVQPDHIAVTGPAQFDFYADPSYVADAASWRSRRGLAPGAPTILYGAGPPSVSPHEDQYVDDLCAAIECGDLPRDLRIVLRRHPNDLPDRWERFRDHPVIAFDDPGAVGAERIRPGQVNLQREQIVDLCSALAHTDVHVSVSSTMTLDGACFHKPQIGPAYDRTGRRRHRRRAADLYAREHFVPIVASGGLELARSPQELVTQVRSALERPERLEAERRAMLAALCTSTDGHATERVAAEVRRFLDTLPVPTR